MTEQWYKKFFRCPSELSIERSRGYLLIQSELKFHFHNLIYFIEKSEIPIRFVLICYISSFFLFF